MTNAQKEELVEELVAEKGKIEKELAMIGQKTDQPGNYDILFPEHEENLEDNALATEEMDRRKALERELEPRLREINKAIEKISTNSYGLCENCTQPIEGERLQAIPTALYCVTCTAKRQ